MNDLATSRLLVVDDDVSNRRTLELALQHEGYEITTASGLEDAIARCEESGFDLALIDLRLPDGSGTELLTLLRTRDPDLPVIVVTGFASLDTAVAALNQGAVAYVIKPLDLADVLATIRQQLEKRRLMVENQRLTEEAQLELEERRRAEAELDLLYAAVESAAEAIVVTDADGAVRYVNPAFEAITGFSKEDIYGGSLNALGGDRLEESFQQTLRAAIAERGTWSGSLESRRKDGSPFREECTVSPVRDLEGRVANYVIVSRDVTERIRLETMAQAVNTMNNIGYVFSGIRHEIGNPINASQMALRTLLDNLERYEPAKIQSYLERALAELGHVGYLLRTLKSFNMFESVELQRIDVRDFIEGFLALSRRDCVKRGVTVTVDIAPDAGSMVADPRALQQVLLNVLTNALDALEGVETRNVHLAVTRECGQTIITLADTGIGMTPRELEGLFRPFSSTKPDRTGLGLVIARKMMSQMGGSIDIESVKGEGTRVELRLQEADGDC